MAQNFKGQHFSTSARVLIGRDREMSTLWKQYEIAAAGHSGVAMLAGEPGIGKTRLLTEVATRASKAGATVLLGGASDAQGMPPYLPFLEAVGPYILAATPDELQRVTEPVGGILTTIFPELTTRLGDLSMEWSLPADQARFRLFEAVGSLLAAIAQSAPLVLILDDLQWADPVTLALLSHVVQHHMTSPILVLGAYRHAEGSQNPALARTLVDLNRLRILEVVALGRLAAGEVDAMGRGYLGGPTEPEVTRQLHLHSEGNPFFTEEVLRAWMESGYLTKEGGRWILRGTTDAQLPPRIADVIRQRLSHLTEDVVTCLRYAAVLGRRFDAMRLAQIVGIDVETVEERMGPALHAQLIQEDGSGNFAFSHDKIRECLYADVTRARRRQLHGIVGHTLEVSPDGSDVLRLSELAFHFTRSNDRARGMRYAKQAAEQAMSAYAFEEAVAHYRDLLNLLEPTDVQRGPITLLSADASLLSGRPREAIPAFELALAWFLELGNREEAGRAAHGLGTAWWRLEEYGRARSAFTSALEVLEETAGPAIVHILMDMGTMLYVSLGREAEGTDFGRRALAMARDLNDERLEGAASRMLGNLLVRSNNMLYGLPLLERALDLARAHDDPREAAECCSCLHNAYMWVGRLKRAHEMVLLRLDYAERCHEAYQMRHISSWLLNLSVMQGDLHAAKDMEVRAQKVIGQLASSEPSAFLLFSRGALAAFQGEYDRAEALMSDALVTFRQMGPAVVTWYLGLLPWVQAAAGKREETMRTIHEVEEIARAMPDGGLAVADILSGTAAAVVMLQDRGRAEHYYRKLMPFRGLWINFLVDRLLGGLATITEDWHAADRHLASAEETARREDNGPELARTLQWRAELELQRGGRQRARRARTLLENAHVLFTRMEMKGEARVVQTRIQSLVTRTSATASGLPKGLSPREAEVLRLVATGKSNREIAQELFLSEKTVINHLTSIFNKTGTNNRVAATVFALRHGLAT